MAAIALALGASLSWGFADFFGPLKGRTLGALRTLIYVQLSGLIAIAIIVAVRGRSPADWASLFAIPAAVSGTLGLYAYYRGMAVGAMSVVAPIAGISAVLPVVVGVVSGDRPSTLKGMGIACTLAGVYLASREPGRTGPRIAAGVGLALLAALGFGGYFFFRVASTSVIATAVAVQRPALAVGPGDLPLLALVGFGDMFGNLLFAAASSRGLISIVSVLASLYPVVTVLLARAVLSERVARTQEGGIVLTLAGVALISAG